MHGLTERRCLSANSATGDRNRSRGNSAPRVRRGLELLEVDRPEGLARHDFAASPPFFSFGHHNRLVVREREGLSMLVFASDDARVDNRRFSAAGLPTFAQFDFERDAKLPNGTQVTVAFSLAFVQSPEMPKVAFFVCENRAQHYLNTNAPQWCHRNCVRLSLLTGSRARRGIRQQDVRRRS